MEKRKKIAFITGASSGFGLSTSPSLPSRERGKKLDSNEEAITLEFTRKACAR